MISRTESIHVNQPADMVLRAVPDKHTLRVAPPVPTPLQPFARIYLNRKIRPLHRDDLNNLKTWLESSSS
jgi:hypothetical protein